MLIKKSVVKKGGTIVFQGSELADAVRYSEEHQEDLKPGESFEIYYRCEEVKDECNH